MRLGLLLSINVFDGLTVYQPPYVMIGKWMIHINEWKVDGPSNEKRDTSIYLQDYGFDKGIFHSFDIDNDGKEDERQLHSMQYTYIGYYFVLRSIMETNIDLNSLTDLYLNESRLKLMK
eukprot:239983_1